LVLCAACVDRALRTGGLQPEREREHSRQAVRGLFGGVSAWVMTGAIAVLMFLLKENGPASEVIAVVVVLVMFMVLITVIVALLGLGQSAAALRTRGDSMILATLGLLLSGLHVGALVGLVLFALWLH
jgi:hypothetical protein